VRTVILNNLEFDHADIYPDLAAIERQMHHLVRTVPPSGRIVCNGADSNLERVLGMGCWSGVERFGGAQALWSARLPAGGPGAGSADADGSSFEVLEAGATRGTVNWDMIGTHNVDNALAAIAAARHAGVPVERAITALGRFKGVRRRMELRGTVAGINVYDDFAHHPTAITTTLDGLRRRVGKQRIIAVLEPRSNTMRMGVHADTLGASLSAADEVWLYAPADLGWDAAATVADLGARAHVAGDHEVLLAGLKHSLRAGDHVLIMSNGGFGGLHTRLLQALKG
jgi:UDP-N-acetylmuramate: L-alanyl-gamma-D-glutamyl-meso-diaminopimelate ligase